MGRAPLLFPRRAARCLSHPVYYWTRPSFGRLPIPHLPTPSLRPANYTNLAPALCSTPLLPQFLQLSPELPSTSEPPAGVLSPVPVALSAKPHNRPAPSDSPHSCPRHTC